MPHTNDCQVLPGSRYGVNRRTPINQQAVEDLGSVIIKDLTLDAHDRSGRVTELWIGGGRLVGKQALAAELKRRYGA